MAAAAGKTTLSHLPVELMCMVAAHLSPTDFLSFSDSCRNASLACSDELFEDLCQGIGMGRTGRTRGPWRRVYKMVRHHEKVCNDPACVKGKWAQKDLPSYIMEEEDIAYLIEDIEEIKKSHSTASSLTPAAASAVLSTRPPPLPLLHPFLKHLGDVRIKDFAHGYFARDPTHIDCDVKSGECGKVPGQGARGARAEVRVKEEEREVKREEERLSKEEQEKKEEEEKRRKKEEKRKRKEEKRKKKEEEEKARMEKEEMDQARAKKKQRVGEADQDRPVTVEGGLDRTLPVPAAGKSPDKVVEHKHLRETRARSTIDKSTVEVNCNDNGVTTSPSAPPELHTTIPEDPPKPSISKLGNGLPPTCVDYITAHPTLHHALATSPCVTDLSVCILLSRKKKWEVRFPVHNDDGVTIGDIRGALKAWCTAALPEEDDVTSWGYKPVTRVEPKQDTWGRTQARGKAKRKSRPDVPTGYELIDWGVSRALFGREQENLRAGGWWSASMDYRDSELCVVLDMYRTRWVNPANQRRRERYGGSYGMGGGPPWLPMALTLGGGYHGQLMSDDGYDSYDGPAPGFYSEDYGIESDSDSDDDASGSW